MRGSAVEKKTSFDLDMVCPPWPAPGAVVVAKMLRKTMLPLFIAAVGAALDRRGLLGQAASLGVTCVAPGRAIAVAAAATDRITLLGELRSLLSRPTPPPFFGDGARAARIDAVLDGLRAVNPTPQPGSTASFAPLAPGTWRVAHAPHIAKLSTLVGARFDPILYLLQGDGSITSHVKYSWLGAADGWLSTIGRYGSIDGSTSFVQWDDAWWEPGATRPADDPAAGAMAPVVSGLGKLGFISAFANFPVEYLDADLCVFVFPFSQTRIAAVRMGGGLDVWGQGMTEQ